MCGSSGCWEAYISNLATLSRYFGWNLSKLNPNDLREAEHSSFTVLDLIARARGGDAKAIAAIHATARFLGLGLGTIVNTLTVGFIVDALLHVLPAPNELSLRWPMLIVGIVVAALGTGLYIGAGLGPGPRDGLMTGLAAKGWPLWAVRMLLELSALAAGWALGGDVGIGTVLFAFSIGPLAHWFLARFHLGVGGVDPDPAAMVGE